jgi:toxin FitB
MILIDTNVVSEVIRPRPNGLVMSWFDRQAQNSMYLSTISIAEIQFGIDLLPEGLRKTSLISFKERTIELFRSYILPFDLSAAELYGRLAVRARQNGRAFPMADGYIAAIATAHNLSVATRDIGPFVAAGVKVINPWAG